MNRKNARFAALIISVLICVILTAVLSTRRINLSEDEPPFSQMKLPLSKASASVFNDYTDFRATDSNGNHFRIIFSIWHKHAGNKCTYAVCITKKGSNEGYYELKDPERAQVVTRMLLRRYARADDYSAASALIELGGKEPFTFREWFGRISSMLPEFG